MTTGCEDIAYCLLGYFILSHPVYGANGNGVYGTALRNGSTDTVFTETVTETDTDERKHKVGNQA